MTFDSACFAILALLLEATMMAAMEPQALLSQRLSILLGFEDGVDDVLELLLSMDSSEVRR